MTAQALQELTPTGATQCEHEWEFDEWISRPVESNAVGRFKIHCKKCGHTEERWNTHTCSQCLGPMVHAGKVQSRGELTLSIGPELTVYECQAGARPDGPDTCTYVFSQ